MPRVSKHLLLAGLLLAAIVLPAVCQTETESEIELHDDIKTEPKDLEGEVNNEKASFDKLTPEEKQQYIEFQRVRQTSCILYS